MKTKTLFAAFFCASLAVNSIAATVPSFSATVFNTKPYSYMVSQGALSENGLVAFNGLTSFENGDPRWTIFHTSGAGNGLAAIPLEQSSPGSYGINNAGTLAAAADVTIPGTVGGVGINNLGQYIRQGTLVTPGGPTVIIDESWKNALVDLNDAGQVIGNIGVYTNTPQGFIYSNGTTQLLSTGSYSNARASHISSNGYVAGTVSTGSDKAGAVWMNGSLQVLDFTSAVDVNRWGVVVGNQQGPSYHVSGMLWINGVSYKLDDLLDAPLPDNDIFDWKLGEVSAINDKGQILVTAHMANDDPLMVLLTPNAPIPEPATYAMLLAGLGIAGYAARRRRTGAHA